jgi:uncharacterized damage-inducible protein DinB
MKSAPSIENIQASQIVKQVINFWLAQNKAINDFFTKHENDVYLKEVAPGRNSGIYLLAHLIATNDGMIPLLDLGDKLFPEPEPLAKEAESAVTFKLSIDQLKKQRDKLNTELEIRVNTLSVSQWLERHTAVSAEDFLLDPTRNKLNILITRASHQNYHRGQLVFLNEKSVAV